MKTVTVMQAAVLLVVLIFAVGCSGSNEAREEEKNEFFQPVETTEPRSAKPDQAAVSKQVESLPSPVAQPTELEHLKTELARRDATIGSLQEEVRQLEETKKRLQETIERVKGENQNLSLKLAEAQNQLADARPAAIVSQPARQPVVPTPVVLGSSRATDFTSRYNQALGLFRQAKYQQAINEFQNLLEAGIPEDLVDNCEYWIGECHYGSKKYSDAIDAMQKVINRAGSNKKDAAYFILGQSYERLGDRNKAREAFQLLEKEFPDSEFTKRARQKLKAFQ